MVWIPEKDIEKIISGLKLSEDKGDYKGYIMNNKKNDTQKNTYEQKEKLLYRILFIVGIGFIFIGIACFFLLTSDIWGNILISVGSGIVTSTIVSLSIEYNNQKRDIKMRKNILIDLVETTKNYCEEEFEFVQMKQLIQSNLSGEIAEMCKLYIPMGIQYYSPEEVKILKELYFVSLNYNQLKVKNAWEKLYLDYKEVFLDIDRLDFKHGPYSEEYNIKESGNIYGYTICDQKACEIGEALHFSKLYSIKLKEVFMKFEDIIEEKDFGRGVK